MSENIVALATFRLFHTLPLIGCDITEEATLISDMVGTTTPYGFLFAPEVYDEYSREDLVRIITKMGLSPEQLNSTFHKSWSKVKNTPLAILIIEQIVHYITTYGFESLGIYNEDHVYIPRDKLEIPQIDLEEFKLTVIHGITIKDLEKRIISLLQSGVALKEDTMKDLMIIIKELKYKIDTRDISNKEMTIKLHDLYGTVPIPPIEFLRYALHKSIGSTLLIKNISTVDKIKQSDNRDMTFKLFNTYAQEYGLKGLASIFFRFKPLFLAFKRHPGMTPVINKIRKMADTWHKPMSPDYLNDLTSMIAQDKFISSARLIEALHYANTFRKIRLAYALQFRTGTPGSIVYRIRNGKSYTTKFSYQVATQGRIPVYLDIVLNSIVESMEPNVKGKRIYIPPYITYALPATEKQFTGYFPSGTSVSVPKDIVFGVHWYNCDNYRVDLDLSLMDVGTKYGWDGLYRGDNDIFFSGDITDAPKSRGGATELFHIPGAMNKTVLLFVNYFNYSDANPAPFSIIVGTHSGDLSKNHLLNPNEVIARSFSKMDQNQKLLGLVASGYDENRFYFFETYMGKGRSLSGNAKYIEHSKQYLLDYLTNMISLNDLLVKAGAIMVDSKDTEEESVEILSLAPEDLDKDTILNLLK